MVPWCVNISEVWCAFVSNAHASESHLRTYALHVACYYEHTSYVPTPVGPDARTPTFEREVLDTL